MSFMDRVARKLEPTSSTITTQAVRSVFVTFSGPRLKSFSAGTTISGWGLLTNTSPTPRNAITTTAMPMTLSSFKSALLRGSLVRHAQDSHEHANAADQCERKAEHDSDESERGLETRALIDPAAD